jgi:hypothetical protein
MRLQNDRRPAKTVWVIRRQGPNQTMNQRPHLEISSVCVCHDALPWLISVSLDSFRSA